MEIVTYAGRQVGPLGGMGLRLTTCLSISSLASVFEEKIVRVVMLLPHHHHLLLCQYDTRIIILSPGSLCSGTSLLTNLFLCFLSAHLVISSSIIMSPLFIVFF